MSSNWRNGLRWAGLIVGLAGVVLFLLLGTGVIWGGEGGLSWGAVFPVLVVYVSPLLAGILIAWKRPFIGGILLIAWGLFWPVAAFIMDIGSSTPLRDLLYMLAYTTLMPGLPMWLPGILFLLSWKTERAYSDERGELIPKLRWAGLVIMGLAGLACFLQETIPCIFPLGGNVLGSVSRGLLLGGSLILLAVAAWAWPLWGSVAGVIYSLHMIAFHIIELSGRRTLLQVLSDYRLDIISMIVLLIGSILVLVSSRKIVREES